NTLAAHSYYFFYTPAHPHLSSFFFFNTPTTTAIYPLSLHDALPICSRRSRRNCRAERTVRRGGAGSALHPARTSPGMDRRTSTADRKSTRLNSSHVKISYAVFCLKKKKKKKKIKNTTTNSKK